MFADRNIDVLDRPASSPDLNPNVNLWGLFVRKIYKNNKQYSTLKELKMLILTPWWNLGVVEVQNLVKSMPNKIFEVIRANGVH